MRETELQAMGDYVRGDEGITVMGGGHDMKQLTHKGVLDNVGNSEDKPPWSEHRS